MSSLARREQVAAAMQAALTTGCAGISVERNRRSPVASDEAPAVVLYDLGHEASLTDYGSISYAMQVEIEGTVSAPESQLGTAVNALYVQILRSFPDPTFGGLCIEMLEVALDVHIAPEAESAKPLATFTVRLQVDFETPDGDPTG